MSQRIFFRRYCYRPNSYFHGKHLKSGFIHNNVKDIPDNGIDWRTPELDAVTPIRDQKAYGTCYAFATAAVLEGIEKIVNNKLSIFSPQELIHFDHCSFGVRGGYIDSCLDFITSRKGLVYDKDYPYYPMHTPTPTRKLLRGGLIDGYQRVPPDIQSFMKALSKQPVACHIIVSKAFIKYKGGIFKVPFNDDGLSPVEHHCVTVVGFKPGKDGFFIIKNSWSETWGDQGYMKMSARVTELYQLFRRAYIPIMRPEQECLLSMGQGDFVSKRVLSIRFLGQFPVAGCEEDVERLINIATAFKGRSKQNRIAGELDKKFLRYFAFGSRAVLNPVAVIFVGIVGHEVVKACTAKFHPLHQFFYFVSLESLPSEPLDARDLKLLNSRYDAQIFVFGCKLQKKLDGTKAFIVGTGALGCEFLKNLALMGVCCNNQGKLMINDDDVIEKSNLIRQFLFAIGICCRKNPQLLPPLLDRLILDLSLTLSKIVQDLR